MGRSLSSMGAALGAGGPASRLSAPEVNRFTPSFGRPSLTFEASPFAVFGSIVSQQNMPLPIARLLEPQMVIHRQNIITLGILTEVQALELLAYFRVHYNHWVSFPETISNEALMDRILQRCALLLTVICCVAIRYHNPDLRAKTYDLLLQRILAELSLSLVVVPQTIEFMQALTILSVYAPSISSGEVVFDAWYFSGIALQHFVTKDVLGLVMSFDGIGPVTEFDELTAYRVWNHLCLVHVANCVMSGRMSVLDDERLELCRRTMDLPAASNFDGRMVAELTLHLITYRFIGSDGPLEQVEAELKEWWVTWEHLWQQPILQFVEAAYYYNYFLVLLYANYVQGALLVDGSRDILGEPSGFMTEHTISACSDAVIERMVYYLSKVMDNLLVVKDDLFFSCLSDQVHFKGSFSAVMMGKIRSILLDLGRTELVTRVFTPDRLARISSLSARFERISVAQDELGVKYASAINEIMKA